MKDRTDRLRGWRTDATVRGLVPYIALIVGMGLLGWRYDYVQTSLADTVEGFETRTIYLRQRGGAFCIGDMVRFRSDARRADYYKSVAAEAGDVLALTATGYSVNGKARTMAEDWLAAATTRMGERETLTVPDGMILFVNPEYEPEGRYNAWAFETVPRSAVQDRITHILMATDLSRIGERLGSDGPCPR